jgi:rare lipoprotein A
MRRLLLLTLLAASAGCAPFPGAISPSAAAGPTCTASVYWEGFGHPLADGQRHSPNELLIAHRTLPFGTRVRISVSSGKSIIALVRDRGPFRGGRCADLSRGVARALGVSGLPRITLEPLP